MNGNVPEADFGKIIRLPRAPNGKQNLLKVEMVVWGPVSALRGLEATRDLQMLWGLSCPEC